jgi:pimeloyl-ACP methyl ester carboxylesterase
MYAEVEFSWPHAEFAGREVVGFDVRSRLGEIGVPCLVIAGAHDMTPPAEVRALHDGLTDSRYRLFEKSGHFAPIEEPEAFRALVFDFLDVD